MKAEVLNGEEPEKKAEKICFICEEKTAKYFIKGNPNDCYCKDCAKDSFGDIDYLEKLK